MLSPDLISRFTDILGTGTKTMTRPGTASNPGKIICRSYDIMYVDLNFGEDLSMFCRNILVFLEKSCKQCYSGVNIYLFA